MKRKTIQITIEAVFIEFQYLCDKLIIDGVEYDSEGKVLDIKETSKIINIGSMIATLPGQIRLYHECHFSQKIEQHKKITDEYYCYLMLDENTGYYKIGKSKNPKFREKTLQSEKPTITLIHVWKNSFYSEKNMHDYFNNKRVRGEWFDLNKIEVEFIKAIK